MVKPCWRWFCSKLQSPITHLIFIVNCISITHLLKKSMNFSAFNKLLFIIFVLSATSCSKKAETSTDTETAKEHWEKLSEELDEVFLEPLEKSMASENKSSSSTPKHSDKYGFENEHVYVDLGLSVYWAVENLGAYNPNGFGEYYCWANIVPSTDDDNEYPDEGLGNISGHPRYDAARAIWGGKCDYRLNLNLKN